MLKEGYAHPRIRQPMRPWGHVNDWGRRPSALSDVEAKPNVRKRERVGHRDRHLSLRPWWLELNNPYGARLASTLLHET
jgi:hypothetical protein